MAYANYQTPTKITFYPSYLQYAYATGLIGDVSNNIDLNDEDIYSITDIVKEVISDCKK